MKDLMTLLAIPTETGECDLMYDYLLDLGHKEGWDMYNDKAGNLYAIKGVATTYPCAVAHMDTVHKIEKGGILPVEVNGKIIGINPLDMEQTGIGGDDKCGIWAALHCLRVSPAAKVAFFVDEEGGCLGSGNCDMTFFKDCRFILQADRRGNSDFVTEIAGEALSSGEFLLAVAPILKRYGYKRSMGLMTDVMELRDNQVGISAANMSAGYYNPHMKCEHIDLLDLENVCALMDTIFREVIEVYPFICPPKVHSSKTTFPDYVPSKSGVSDSAVDAWNAWSGGSETHARCSYCNMLSHLALDLMQLDPPICIDCAIYKDEHGFYPVANESSFWRRLAGGGKRKRHRQDKYNRSNGGQ